ncbi:MAG: dimethylmenaquinone methyltransferase [Gemmatimonadetes bacterium]|nr:dimethylmenaquinone methyltransferase [Gemmatimonadota bacterium]
MGYKMKEFPVPLQEMCERYEKLFVANVYDVLDREGFGLPNQCLSIDIKPLTPHMHLAGPAFTVKGQRDVRTFEEMGDKGVWEDFALFRALFPNCVIIQNSEALPHVGAFGSIMARSAKNQGARGVVVDGGTRDAEDMLRIPDWKAFVRHWSPVESYPRYMANDFMCPIAMSGTLTHQVRVNPYDWVVGDWDAVVIVPQEIAYEVLLKAEEMQKMEDLSRRDLDRGDPVWEVFERYGRL